MRARKAVRPGPGRGSMTRPDRDVPADRARSRLPGQARLRVHRAGALLRPGPNVAGIGAGTGPYMITRYVPRRLVDLRPQPLLPRMVSAAQPGSPDRIVWRFGHRPPARPSAIEAGQADWADDLLPGPAGSAPGSRPRHTSTTLPAIAYTAFNTRVPPFNDPRVRRAFSLAADRRRLVALLGGPDLATPPARSCHPASPATGPTARSPSTPAPPAPGSAPTWPPPAGSWPHPGRRACASPCGPTA